jgi:hypothetical protein
MSTVRSFTIDAGTNVIGGSQMNNAVQLELSTAGEYTFTLTASDFRENSGNPSPQRHVFVLSNSHAGNWRAFSLNGVGDSVTVTTDEGTPVSLFFVDNDPWWDNTGSSTVQVRQGSTLLGNYVIDSRTNVIGGSQMDNAVQTELSTAGEYTFTLTASDFRENSGNPSPQRHVFVLTNSHLGDRRAFSLNGVGDSVTVTANEGAPVFLFFVDNDPWWDNTGSSTVEITP